MARLSINTNPWGAITIDGVPLAVKGAFTKVIAGQSRTTTPLLDFPIKPGKHVVRVEQFDDAGKMVQRGEREIELAAGQAQTLNIPMKPLP